ncbi:alpha/beta hydrolase [Actinopolymorpha alba]|uniref:alpha/beta hydrolase n=1 Tax=Actinopolymorpha alba TaxID=533267 RepID=UPI000685143B|nr:alpha/beta hydrolase [Actinopolymorpha alba]
MASYPEQARYDANPSRVAIVLPGGGYTPAAPLLHYARAVLLHRGWTVQEIWWGDPPDQDSIPDWVREQAEAALARETAEQVLLVGKSRGTHAAPLAAVHGIPAIWLTPVLADPTVIDGLTRASKPSLLVGGTADGLWKSDVAKRSGAGVLEVPEANHAMEIEDDPIRSVSVLGQVTEAMDHFVARLS